MKQNNKMRVIGLTGGVGAGKSTVLAFLEKDHGAFVLQADALGHQLMEPGGPCYGPVVDLFGNNVIKEDKTIDRKQVSDVVFSQPEMLKQLDDIIHPAVRQAILDSVAEQRAAGRPLFVIEAALLLEEKYEDFCDEVWYVHADEEIRIRRLMESRGYTREKAVSIIAKQASEEFFRAHADVVIENNGSPEKTRIQVAEGVHKI